MSVWIIEPADPLIARDGRPFGATPGVRARSLPFPYPSTTTGGVRTRAGQNGHGRFDANLVDKVKAISVRGPLLAEVGEDGTVKVMIAAPADALLFDEANGTAARKWLRPLALPQGAATDLPTESDYVVGLPEADTRKPSRKAPGFWYWEKFKQWLISPVDDTLKPDELGHSGPQSDLRTHVAIDPQTMTGIDGMLFMTSGLTFWHSTGGKDGEAALSHMKRMALIVETGNDDDLGQSTGYGPLGGERRLMYWRDGTDALSPLAQPPSEVLEAVKESGYCRIILLTPGIFAEGWRPDVTNWAAHNVQPELVAAAVDKPTVISGWDLAAVPPGPKPTRRLAPAGSVYYLHLKGKADDIGQWLSDTWLTCLSDDTEDRASGFGLAAIGVFDGAAAQLVIKEDHDA